MIASDRSPRVQSARDKYLAQYKSIQNVERINEIADTLLNRRAVLESSAPTRSSISTMGTCGFGGASAPLSPSPFEIWDKSPALTAHYDGTRMRVTPTEPDSCGCVPHIQAADEFYITVCSRNPVASSNPVIITNFDFETLMNNVVSQITFKIPPTAEWDDSKMVFGRADGTYFRDFHLHPDAITHELGHAVVRSLVPRWRNSEEGKVLDEHLADVFAITHQHRTIAKDSGERDPSRVKWLIGEDLVVHGTALRSMDDPGSAYPDHPDGKIKGDPQSLTYERGADPHTNSGIPNHAFYQLAIPLGAPSWELPFVIWFESLQMSVRVSKIVEFARQTLSEARKRGVKDDLMRDAWEKAGISI